MHLSPEGPLPEHSAVPALGAHLRTEVDALRTSTPHFEHTRASLEPRYRQPNGVCPRSAERHYLFACGQ